MYIVIFIYDYLQRQHAILVVAHAVDVWGNYIHFIGKRAIKHGDRLYNILFYLFIKKSLLELRSVT